MKMRSPFQDLRELILRVRGDGIKVIRKQSAAHIGF